MGDGLTRDQGLVVRDQEAVCRSPVSCRRALAEAKPCDPSGGGALNCFGTIQYKYHSIMAVLRPRAVYVGV